MADVRLLSLTAETSWQPCDYCGFALPRPVFLGWRPKECACRTMFYCDSYCIRIHWKTHKPECLWRLLDLRRFPDAAKHTASSRLLDLQCHFCTKEEDGTISSTVSKSQKRMSTLEASLSSNSQCFTSGGDYILLRA